MAQQQDLHGCDNDREPSADIGFQAIVYHSMSNSQISPAVTSQPTDSVDNPAVPKETSISPSVASVHTATVPPSADSAISGTNASLHPDELLLFNLPTEVKQKVLKALPDVVSLAAAVASCKHLRDIFQGHKTGILAAVIGNELVGIDLAHLHDGAIAALKLPPNPSSALRNIDDFINALSTSTSTSASRDLPTDDPNYTAASEIKRLMFPALAQGVTTEAQNTKKGFDAIRGGPHTLRDALELCRVHKAHRALMALFLDHQQQEQQEREARYGAARTQEIKGDPMDVDRIASALWAFELFCRLFGADDWWLKRWRHSVHFMHIMKAFQWDWIELSTKDVMRAHEFLQKLVSPLWGAATGGTSCGCQQQQQQQQQQPQVPDGVSWCNLCRDRSLRGTLAGGLHAIYAIHRAEGLTKLKACFVWHDGRPREHRFFLQQFYDYHNSWPTYSSQGLRY